MKTNVECPNDFSVPTVNKETGCGGFPSLQECQDCKLFVGKRIDLSSLTPKRRAIVEMADALGD